MDQHSKIGVVVIVILVVVGSVQLLATSYFLNQDRSGQSGGGNDVMVVEMLAKQFAFEPSKITVQQGTDVALKITSTAEKEPVYDAHGITISGYGIAKSLPVGETTWVNFTADSSGEFQFRCTVYCGAGHVRMKGRLVVEPAS